MSWHRALETFAHGYIDEVTSLSYADLVDEEPAPHGCLACGAAGIAWTLWRASHAREALSAEAARWVRETEARRDDPEAFGGAELSSSLYFGPGGLDLMAAILGDTGALARFADRARASMDGAAELFHGAAGFLVGATILAARDAAGTAELEAELREHLAAVELDDPSMAHGEAGVLLALLGAAQRRAEPVSGVVVDRLEALDETDGVGRFCAGPAGRTVLWARAAALTGEPRHRQRATDAAELAYRERHRLPDFCCGLVGSGYAMLAMSRLDPEPWRERAAELAIAALASEIETEWVHGLFKGESGLACLALDLVGGGASLPGLEP